MTSGTPFSFGAGEQPPRENESQPSGKRRLGEPASSASDFVTGVSIPVDGGYAIA